MTVQMTEHDVWQAHNRAWRHPNSVIAQSSDYASVDPALLEYEITGDWWETLDALGMTIIVSREYEHLLLAASAAQPNALSYMSLPHPSGIAFDAVRNQLLVAATRNPNMIYEFAPASGRVRRSDVPSADQINTVSSPEPGALVPIAARFLPGSLYLHDLAVLNGTLIGNAAGHNCIAKFESGEWHRIWWPACVERDGRPDFTQNYIQLNSIAAGKTLESSFYTASSAEIGAIRPGDVNYPVDKRGVLFSGATREPVATGLTRPHSARFDRSGKVWLANSGYGEFGYVDIVRGTYEPVIRFMGWTRGVAIHGDFAFVGTSRIIPRFESYAPGLDPANARCGIHIVDLKKGTVVGSLAWSQGNQIFAIECIPSSISSGLPFALATPDEHCNSLFYAFTTGKGEFDGY